MASAALPETMQVVRQPDASSTNIVLEKDQPLPTLSQPDECLIRIYTASPCFSELYWGLWFPHLFNPGQEKVPCTEAAGVIVKMASAGDDANSASGFKVGDEVLYRLEPTQAGNLREFGVARISQMAHKPRNVGWAEAGATPLSSLTAWQGVFQHGVLNGDAIFGDEGARKENAKRKVLITGASGVVGSWAVQFAALAGAGQVVALAGGESAAELKRLGATEVVDYKTQSLGDWVAEDQAGREVDAVLDCVGKQTLSQCWSATKEGGVLLSVSNDPSEYKPDSVHKKLAEAKWFLVEPNGEQLESIAKLLGDGKVEAKVDSVVDFADYQSAFDKVEARKAKGKVVIRIRDD